MQKCNTGGGTYDPKDTHIYFIASGAERLFVAHPYHDYLLIAVNELEGELSLSYFEEILLVPKKKVFLDSGVYNLATQHAKRHHITMDEALCADPETIDGFSSLFTSYVALVKKYEDRLWGYIEIDQGGKENKKKTRKKLESLGLRPIPVYHPFNDGWDYFDELAGQYDRICFGNIVKATSKDRKHLIATAWERKRNYPDLWIHFLGLTPNQWLNAFPMSSGDSSSWLSSLRWSHFSCYCDGQSLGEMGEAYQYILGEKSDHIAGSRKALAFSGYVANMNTRCWRAHLALLEQEGFCLYPPL